MRSAGPRKNRWRGIWGGLQDPNAQSSSCLWGKKEKRRKKSPGVQNGARGSGGCKKLLSEKRRKGDPTTTIAQKRLFSIGNGARPPVHQEGQQIALPPRVARKTRSGEISLSGEQKPMKQKETMALRLRPGRCKEGIHNPSGGLGKGLERAPCLTLLEKEGRREDGKVTVEKEGASRPAQRKFTKKGKPVDRRS